MFSNTINKKLKYFVKVSSWTNSQKLVNRPLKNLNIGFRIILVVGCSIMFTIERESGMFINLKKISSFSLIMEPFCIALNGLDTCASWPIVKQMFDWIDNIRSIHNHAKYTHLQSPTLHGSTLGINNAILKPGLL